MKDKPLLWRMNGSPLQNKKQTGHVRDLLEYNKKGTEPGKSRLRKIHVRTSPSKILLLPTQVLLQTQEVLRTTRLLPLWIHYIPRGPETANPLHFLHQHLPLLLLHANLPITRHPSPGWFPNSLERVTPVLLPSCSQWLHLPKVSLLNLQQCFRLKYSDTTHPLDSRNGCLQE